MAKKYPFYFYVKMDFYFLLCYKSNVYINITTHNKQVKAMNPRTRIRIPVHTVQIRATSRATSRPTRPTRTPTQTTTTTSGTSSRNVCRNASAWREDPRVRILCTALISHWFVAFLLFHCNYDI